MKLLTLKLSNLFGVKEMTLQFSESESDESPSVYLIDGQSNWEAISLALLLMCSTVYDTLSRIQEIWNTIRRGKIEISFVLTQESEVTAPEPNPDDHSSDSDVPCTSEQARIRSEARRKRKSSSHIKTFKFQARRNFVFDPLLVEYTINNGPIRRCSIKTFNKNFFSCTDVILPNLNGLVDGDCNNGRWLGLLSNDFLYRGKGENDLLIKFCELYSSNPVGRSPLGHLTTTFLVGRYTLDQTRIAYLIGIFQDIRRIFEYVTFSEYTVWFLLPQVSGDLCDIGDLTTNSINFDLMQTKIQLNIPSAPKYPWSDADGYIRELFLISVQLAFGFNCSQNIVYLHSLRDLQKHQSFEYIRYLFAKNSGGANVWTFKNYMQRIVNACAKSGLTCIIEHTRKVSLTPKSCSFVCINKS